MKVKHYKSRRPLTKIDVLDDGNHRLNERLKVLDIMGKFTDVTCAQVRLSDDVMFYSLRSYEITNPEV